MGLIALMIAIYVGLRLANKKETAKKYKDFILDYPWAIMVGCMILAVAVDLNGFEDSFLYNQCIDAFAMFVLGIPYFIGRFVFKKIKKYDKGDAAVEINKMDYEKSKLPVDAKVRAKVIERFSNKYNLNLTDEEINRIVDGSFMSEEWTDEVVAMCRDYTDNSEWYNTKNSWLRAYLKAFYIQNVSSDFEFQKKLCIQNYNEIFNYTDTKEYMSVSECVKDVNNKFMTNFEEAEFMIAYRFLQSNGLEHNIPIGKLVRTDSEIKEAEEKYSGTVSLSKH